MVPIALAWAPLVVPIGAGLLALLFDSWTWRRTAVLAGAVGLAAAAVAAGHGVRTAAVGEAGGIIRFGGVFVTGRWVSGAAAALLGLSAVAIAGGWRTLSRSERGGQVAALSCLSAGAAVAAFSTQDILMVVIALETAAVCAYGLVASAGTDDAGEAAMKYLVQGAIVSGLAVVAIGTLYAVGGGSFASSGEMLSQGGAPVAAAVGFALLTCMLAFKAGAFPFHAWTPDAYGSAEPVTAGYLASVPKAASLAAAGMLLGGVIGGTRHAWVPAMIAIGSIVFGNLVALRQTSFRRMLAYSGVAHAGYAFTALVTSSAATSIAVYGVTYAISALGAFLVAEAVLETHPSYDGSIRSLSGLWKQRPVLAVALAVCLLSLTGIPLTVGFVGKLVVFGSLVGQGAAGGPWGWLAVVGVMGSVVSFGYYGNVMRVAFFTDPKRADDAVGRPGSATTAAVLCALLAIVAGCLPLVVGLSRALSLLGVG